MEFPQFEGHKLTSVGGFPIPPKQISYRGEGMKCSTARLFPMFVISAISTISAQTGFSAERCDQEGITFEGWKDWFQITAKPVKSIGHSNSWVGIYVDELAKDIYLSAGQQYPVCAKIVKPSYYDAEGKTVRKLMIMMKMPPGYDPENGDWWYATSDASGTTLGDQGRRDDCIMCHKQAAETDYLFSADVLEAAKE